MNLHIHIKTTLSPSMPKPTPLLIADLVDAVLKVPGLRVQSVEVLEVTKGETITRRVRHVADERIPGAVKAIKLIDNAIKLVNEALPAATAKPGEGTEAL